MAIKKSQIYSTLWNACDALRGSMDASQYKDYVLILLFVKYLSDKADNADTVFVIPDGCSFSDFVALKGSDGIGEAVNKKLEAIKSANYQVLAKIALPNFNDPDKLGKGREMTDTLSKLIGVFQDSNLDFSKNRSADDDILGDAYEYLMKNFAAQSGKSKGQFYTPAEVSRTMAKMLGLSEFTKPSTTIYDPTCGSASLLLRAMAETPNGATPYGQEKDNATASLAILNMLLHGVDVATIEQGDTINNPQFVAAGNLQTFNICVANPPFSTKQWLGAAGEDDIYHRWKKDLCPPAKCGDYAFLLHLIASMKPDTGRGACILPHGVLFRGNAEYSLRKEIVESGVIEGIVGLPPNVFFGTGIPACIIMLNKKDAAHRKGIFFIDAKEGFMKDGDKNRLREQDIKKITDTWEAREDVPHYARFVPFEEIREKNDYNLNIPRYIQARSTEIEHDIEAHLHGGLPKADIDRMSSYWEVCPALPTALFAPIAGRSGYYQLACPADGIASAIEHNESFIAQQQSFEQHIRQWANSVKPEMMSLGRDIKPKEIIVRWAQSLLDEMLSGNTLVNAYDVYQQLMEYWTDTLQDDCYMIAHDGWKLTVAAEKKKSPTYEDYTCDLLPTSIVLHRYFKAELEAIQDAKAQSDDFAAQMQQIVDDAVDKYITEYNEDSEEPLDEESEEYAEGIRTVTDSARKTAKYKALKKKKTDADKALREQRTALTVAMLAKYDSMTEAEIKPLVVNEKWIAEIANTIQNTMSQALMQLVSEVSALSSRYADTLESLMKEVNTAESKVMQHLTEMGFEV